MSATSSPDRSRRRTSGSASTSASGPTASTSSSGSSARRTSANLHLRPKTRETTMNEISTIDAYGVVSEPATLTMQRLLPGPVERIWGYLTESDLRRRWLAAGEMTLEVGAPFEFVWRNDELTDPPGARPDGFGGEHRMQSRITELDPPRRIAFTWNGSGEVS